MNGVSLRADAARNSDRIVRVARQVYAEIGPDVPMGVVADRAGLNERTLYRLFGTKGDLARAVIDHGTTENLSPVIASARESSDPLQGLIDLLEAAMMLAVRERNALAAARKVCALAGISSQLEDALYQLARRAQLAGLIRPDVVAADLFRILVMLHSVLQTMDPTSNTWRRYVFLVCDALTTTSQRQLPPVAPLQLSDPANQ